MLTGDKLETAENIGESCKLLHRHGMIRHRLSDEFDVVKFTSSNISEENAERIKEGKMMGLLVEAKALKAITEDEMAKAKFLEISKTCEAVICCRVSPG